MNKKVLVVGAGLAGCEAAFYLAQKGINVVLAECKEKKLNSAQKISSYAELVCTNSLKSKEVESAHGLLKHEMAKLGSICLQAAEVTKVPAGGALAVDRVKFSNYITDVIKKHSLIKVINIEVSDPIELSKKEECDYIIIASGPLTTPPLESWICDNICGEDLYFYDAIAPVVDADSLDMSKLYYKDRYVDENGEAEADYLNAPLTKEEYYRFVAEIKNASKVAAKDFEDLKFFESCLPIDTMVDRGVDTLRFSCMKPVGLRMKNGDLPFAVVQLRRENLLGSAFNLVGFQNRLTHKEQVRIFRMIPGLENATFNHLGSVHRNTFINSSKLLNFDFSWKKQNNIYFAGQIAGVEGYTESAAIGLYVAFSLFRRIEGRAIENWPVETAIGAMVNYLFTLLTPKPSNINFGLIPSIPLDRESRKKDRGTRKKIKKGLVVERAKKTLDEFMEKLSHSM